MQVTPTAFTIAQFCDSLRRKDIVVNRDYQRSPKVWPTPARSYLIDTILSGYPIPKISLYQTTDLRTRTTTHEIVDGQQRSRAILDFYEDKFRLSGKLEHSGRLFSQLDEEVQQRFLSYQLSVDVFVAATPEDIRQVFRRINSYTIPLNPQERRHATHQGPFKWFIAEMTERYSQSLKDMGVFRESQLSRMQDSKLLTDLCFTFDRGIESQSEKKLDAYYDDGEDEYPAEEAMRARLDRAFSQLIGWDDLHGGSLMRSYQLFSLVLALGHVHDPVDALQVDFPLDAPLALNEEVVLPNLGVLADVLEEPDSHPEFSEFIKASSGATTRVAQRRTRFRWFCEALGPDLLHEKTPSS